MTNNKKKKSYLWSLMLTTTISKGHCLSFCLHWSASLFKSAERFILVSAAVLARLEGLELDIGTDSGISSPLKCKIF